MQQYNAALDQYFWRQPGARGQSVRGSAGSRQAGAEITLQADLEDGLLRKVGFRVFACPHIIACCNFLAEQLEGRPSQALTEVAVDELRLKFDIPVEKAGKLLILKDALAACYNDLKRSELGAQE